MRSWYVIYDRTEHQCSFVSVNLLKGWMHLKLNNVTFKIHLNTKNDYYDAKRGIQIKALAVTRTVQKPIQIIFK